MSTEFLVSKRPASEPYLGRLPARALVPAPLVKEAGAFPPRLGAPALPDCYAAPLTGIGESCAEEGAFSISNRRCSIFSCS